MLRTEKILGTGLLLIMAGFAVWGHFNLPDVSIPVHFNANGAADGYQPRDIGLIVLPGVSLTVMVLMLWILPRFLPTIMRSATVYGIITISILTLLAATQTILVLSAAGADIDHVRLGLAGISLLFLILGNYMPKMRQNRIMGIRTPWTLSDERVWDRTHRFAGILFMISGFLILCATLFAPIEWGGAVLVISTLVTAVVSCAYSYIAARRLR